MTVIDADDAGGVAESRRRRVRSDWTLLSNHGRVLVCIARDADTRLRDIARQVGITERAVFGIVDDLDEAGIIKRVKVGRRNRYLINVDSPLRHDLVAGLTVGVLLGAFTFAPADPDVAPDAPQAPPHPR